MAASIGRNFRYTRIIQSLNRYKLNTVPYCFSRHLTSQPPVSELSIPEWKAPSNESVQLQRARLLYQSRKRGMTENGLLLSTFADRYLDSFNEEELKLYDTLINKPDNDWDLFHWIVGHKPVPKEYDNAVMDILKTHAQNSDMESRIVQPSLPEKQDLSSGSTALLGLNFDPESALLHVRVMFNAYEDLELMNEYIKAKKKLFYN